MIASLNVLVIDGEGQRVELSQQVGQEEGGLRRGIVHEGGLEQLERSIYVEEVIDGLDPELAKICRLLQKKSVAEVARQLRIPRTTLIAKIGKIRERFSQAGFDAAK